MNQKQIKQQNKQAANAITLVMIAGTFFTTLGLSIWSASLLPIHGLLLLPATALLFLLYIYPVYLLFRYVLGSLIAVFVGLALGFGRKGLYLVLGLLGLWLLLQLGQCGGFLGLVVVAGWLLGMTQRVIK